MSLLNFNCECGGGVGALGTPACIKNASLTVREIYVNTYAKDGTRNSIKFADLTNGKLTPAYLLTMLNHPDPTKRWSLTPDRMEEVANARTDKQTQESSTGTIKTLRFGVKTRSSELWDVPESWGANINKGNCVSVSVFPIGEGNEFSGESSKDGSEMFPLLIEKGTLTAESFDANADKNAYTAISYQLSRNINEGAYITLSGGDVEADIVNARSNIGIAIAQGSTANTATVINVTAKNCSYGTFGDVEKLVGATTTADWNVTDSAGAAIAISLVTETTEGYAITIASTPTAPVNVSYITGRTSEIDFGWIAEPSTIITGS